MKLTGAVRASAASPSSAAETIQLAQMLQPEPCEQRAQHRGGPEDERGYRDVEREGPRADSDEEQRSCRTGEAVREAAHRRDGVPARGHADIILRPVRGDGRARRR